MFSNIINTQINNKTDMTTLNAIREILIADGFSMEHKPTTTEPYLKLGTPNSKMWLFIDEANIYLIDPNFQQLYDLKITSSP